MSDAKIFKIELKPKSGWVSFPTADMIFGQLCWHIKFNLGEETLEKFLKDMEEKPIFTISDMLPNGYIPKPITPYDTIIFGTEGSAGEERDKIKKFAKIKYIPEEVFFGKDQKYKTIFESYLKIFESYKQDEDGIKENVKKLREELVKMPNDDFFSLVLEEKNVINRLAGTTLENALYSLPVYINTNLECINNNGYCFMVLLKIIDEEKFGDYKILENLEKVFKYGFGSKKSTGKGVFEVSYTKKELLPRAKSKKRTLLLSGFIPKSTDSTRGYYKVYNKFPKLGEIFSLAGFNFYKRPIVMIDKGSVFFHENDVEYMGKMLTNMSIANIKNLKGERNLNVYHYAYGFTLEI